MFQVVRRGPAIFCLGSITRRNSNMIWWLEFQGTKTTNSLRFQIDRTPVVISFKYFLKNKQLQSEKCTPNLKGTSFSKPPFVGYWETHQPTPRFFSSHIFLVLQETDRHKDEAVKERQVAGLAVVLWSRWWNGAWTTSLNDRWSLVMI